MTQYRTRQMDVYEIISSNDWKTPLARCLLPAFPRPYVINYGSHIVGVFKHGKLLYEHKDRGIVSEDCQNIEAAISRLRELIEENKA